MFYLVETDISHNGKKDVHSTLSLNNNNPLKICDSGDPLYVLQTIHVWLMI